LFRKKASALHGGKVISENNQQYIARFETVYRHRVQSGLSILGAAKMSNFSMKKATQIQFNNLTKS